MQKVEVYALLNKTKALKWEDINKDDKATINIELPCDIDYLNDSIGDVPAYKYCLDKAREMIPGCIPTGLALVSE